MKKINIIFIIAMFLIIGSMNVFGALTDGLVHFYYLNETSGTTHYDKINPSSNLTRNGGAIVSSSKIGAGVNITGTGDYMQNTGMTNLPLGDSSRSYSMCVNLYSVGSGTQNLIGGWGTATNNQFYSFGLLDSSLRTKITVWGYANDYTDNTTLSNDQKYCFVSTYDNSTSRAYFYVNGVLTYNDTRTDYATTGNAFKIGGQTATVNLATLMVINKIGIYNRQLTSQEVLTLYQQNQDPYNTTIITNFSIALTNNYNNASISNFSAIINGTTYNTTTGTITTPLLSNSTILYNITIVSQNMFNKTYLNQNISTSLSATQDQYPIIYAKNIWNQSNVSSFNVTNGGFYNASNGLVYVFANASTNVLVQSANYFPLNTTLSLLQNTIQSVNLSQSVINMSLREFDSNISLSNFTVNISGYSSLFNVSGLSMLIYPNAGNYTVASIIDNTGSDIYQIVNNSFSINSLDNKSLVLYVFEHSINVSARDISNNASIQNFMVYLNDTFDFTDNRVFSNVNGSIVIPVVHHNYTVTIVSAPGYAFFDAYGNYNSVANFSITSNRNVTFYLYKYNSVNFTFYDVASSTSPLSTVNISLNLIYSNASANYSTGSGSIFIENLTSGDWEARYDAPGYNPNDYFFTVLESSTQRINLYLQNDSLTTLFKVLLRDQNDGVVSGNIIRLQKQFEVLNGQFVTIRECQTNEIGVCYMYIQEGIETSYRFVVIDTDGNMIKVTEASPIVTLASEDKVITIRVDTGANLIEPMQRLINVYGLINLNNNVSTFTFIDGLNAITGGCLKVSQKYYNSQSTYSVINYTCISGTSGIINFNYSAYLVNDTSLLFEGFANYTDSQYPIYTMSLENKVFAKNSTEDDNLFFFAIFFMFVAFAMLWVPNLYIQLAVDFGCMVGVVAIGYTLIGVPVIMSFMALGYFIHWDRKSARGFN